MSILGSKRTVNEPSDRLTRLCAVAGQAIDADPERGDERMIVALMGHGYGGLVHQGYDDDDAQAAIDLCVQAQAIVHSLGRELTVYVDGEKAL